LPKKLGKKLSFFSRSWISLKEFPKTAILERCSKVAVFVLEKEV